jgi:hypothetical protein
MMEELIKAIKFPLMTSEFLASEVLPVVMDTTVIANTNYKRLVIDCICYQNMASKLVAMEQPGARTSSQRNALKSQLLLMQSILCSSGLASLSSFQPRDTVELEDDYTRHDITIKNEEVSCLIQVEGIVFKFSCGLHENIVKVSIQKLRPEAGISVIYATARFEEVSTRTAKTATFNEPLATGVIATKDCPYLQKDKTYSCRIHLHIVDPTKPCTYCM